MAKTLILSLGSAMSSSDPGPSIREARPLIAGRRFFEWCFDPAYEEVLSWTAELPGYQSGGSLRFLWYSEAQGDVVWGFGLQVLSGDQDLPSTPEDATLVVSTAQPKEPSRGTTCTISVPTGQSVDSDRPIVCFSLYRAAADPRDTLADDAIIISNGPHPIGGVEFVYDVRS